MGPLTRSEIMSRIRSKGTGPEVALRKALWAAGLRGYRKNWGRPSVDVAWVGRKVAVFLDSCFWHSCPEHGKVPKTNREWWLGKFEYNRALDRRVIRHYEDRGWTVLRFWTHQPAGEMIEAVRTALA